MVSSPEERSVLIAAPLSDTILLGDIAAVLHHLGVPDLLLELGAPHDGELVGEDSHTAPWFVEHLQPTHWEGFHLGTMGGQWYQSGCRLTFSYLAVHLSDLHTNRLPPLHAGLDELSHTTSPRI